MKILLVITGFILFGTTSLIADTASFRTIRGEVAYRLSGQNWTKAIQGVSLPAGTVISTGFHSRAELDFAGSLIILNPLTQLTISEFDKNQADMTISLFLTGGTVHVEVKQDRQHNTHFVVASPAATVSTRAAGFDFDGNNLLVEHGQVRLSNHLGMSQSVATGEFSSASRSPAVTQHLDETPQLNPLVKTGLSVPNFTLKLLLQ